MFHGLSPQSNEKAVFIGIEGQLQAAISSLARISLELMCLTLLGLVLCLCIAAESVLLDLTGSNKKLQDMNRQRGTSLCVWDHEYPHLIHLQDTNASARLQKLQERMAADIKAEDGHVCMQKQTDRTRQHTAMSKLHHSCFWRPDVQAAFGLRNGHAAP